MEISTHPARDLELRACQVEVLASYQKMISHGTAMLWLELARLHEELTEPGYRRFVADEVACLLKVSPRSACRLVDNALTSAAFPAVLALLASGEWTPSHAQAVVGERDGSALERADQDRVLELVLARAGNRTPWQLAALVRASCLVLDLDAAERRRDKASHNRHVMTMPLADGQAGLWAAGPAPEVRAMMCALDAGLGPREPGDERTLAERRFDLLRDLVCGDAQPGQWELQVVVALETLTGADPERLADLPGYGPVLPSEARRLAASAGMRRVVADEQGKVLAVDDRVHRPDVPALAPGRRLTEQTPPAPHELTLPSDVADPEVDVAPVEPGDRAWLDQAHGADDDACLDDARLQDALEAYDPLVDAPLSREDREWLEDTTWREPVYAQIDRLLAQRNPTVTPVAAGSATTGTPAPAGPTWSVAAWASALRRLGTDEHAPRDLSTHAYPPPLRLRRYLNARDRTCTFPGCPRLVTSCHKDHLLPWPLGSTTASNLANECEHHHQAKHACFGVARLPDGTLRWRSPTGRTYDRPPEPLLPW